MRKGHFVVKTVPLTTNNLNQAIVNHLISEGHVGAARVNNTGVWDEKAQCFRRSGARKGLLDISSPLLPFGRLLVIDTKVSTGDKPSREQLEYAADVRTCGGLAWFCHNYTEYINLYNEHVKPYMNGTQRTGTPNQG